jgi:solute:Na+ symporter, SSS family
VAIIVSMVTRPKPDSELVGLTWSLTSKEDRSHGPGGAAAGVLANPVALGIGVLVLTVILYIVV